MRRWGVVKRSFQSSVIGEPSQLDLPQAYQNILPEDLRGDGVAMIPYSTIVQIFETAISRICKLVDAQKTLQPACQTIMLVGAFANCKFVQERLSQLYPNQIIADSKADEAVLKGAVVYGLFPNFLRSRSLPGSFAIDVCRPAQPFDPLRKLIAIGESDFTSDVLKVVVPPQQLMASSYTIVKRFRLPESGSPKSLAVYYVPVGVTADNAPLFSTDDGVKFCGRAQLSFADPHVRAVEISLTFTRISIRKATWSRMFCTCVHELTAFLESLV